MQTRDLLTWSRWCCPPGAGRLFGGGSFSCGTCHTGCSLPGNIDYRLLEQRTEWIVTKADIDTLSRVQMYFSPSASHTLANFRKRLWSKILWMPKWWQSLKTEWKNYGNKCKPSSKIKAQAWIFWSRPCKVVPLVHVDAIFLVGHDLIEEGLVPFTAFIRPFGGWLRTKEANPGSFNNLNGVESAAKIQKLLMEKLHRLS